VNVQVSQFVNNQSPTDTFSSNLLGIYPEITFSSGSIDSEWIGQGVTPPAGVRKGADHTVEYVGSASPDPLVVDFDLIRTAPGWLNVAGVGDILSCHTACVDWELAHAAGRR
jgi:hypothetical protein